MRRSTSRRGTARRSSASSRPERTSSSRGFRPGRWTRGGSDIGSSSPSTRGWCTSALSTHGQFGPRAEGSGPEYDLIDQALSGLAYITGEPGEGGPETGPTRVGSWISAYAQAAWAGVATLAALHWREASGRGQMIDVSGAEALMRYLEYTLLLYHGSREVRERLGGMDLAVSVYTFIPVKDGWAFIAGYTDPNFGAICRIMGRPELAQDPRFRTTLDRTRPEARAAVRDEIARWSVNYTASEILAKVLADPGPGTVVFGPVNQPDPDPGRGPLVGARVLRPARRSGLRAAHARGAGLADDADSAPPEGPGPAPRISHARTSMRGTSGSGQLGWPS